MLRKYGLLQAFSILLLTGCDFFSTRDFVAKPGDIRPLQGLWNPGDSLVFRVTESLRDPAGGKARLELARKRIRFLCLGDSVRGADTLKAISARITEEATGSLLEEGRRLLQFGSQGVMLENPEGGGGARFFPLKTAASGFGDSGSFLALPLVFSGKTGWRQPMGILDVSREILDVDTLAFRDHLEETWKVAETVRGGDQVLTRGEYWYGASGLLKSEQTWADFRWRTESAVDTGFAELRRQVERL